MSILFSRFGVVLDLNQVAAVCCQTRRFPHALFFGGDDDGESTSYVPHEDNPWHTIDIDFEVYRNFVTLAEIRICVYLIGVNEPLYLVTMAAGKEFNGFREYFEKFVSAYDELREYLKTVINRRQS